MDRTFSRFSRRGYHAHFQACVIQSGSGGAFIRVFQFSPVFIIPPILYNHLLITDPIHPSIHDATTPSGPWPPSQDASIHIYS